MIFTPYPQIDVDDDASQSSTFEVDAFAVPKMMSRSSFCRPKKSVAFDETKNEVRETKYPKEECVERWYTAYELQSFRSMVGFSAKQMQRGSAMFEAGHMSAASVLESTYQACLGMMYDDIEILCPVESEQLFSALCDATFPIGLTSYASPAMRRDLRMRRQKVVSIVMLIQRTVKEQHVDATAEYIRMSLESISRPSRLYAQLIGQTQAACLL